MELGHVMVDSFDVPFVSFLRFGDADVSTFGLLLYPSVSLDTIEKSYPLLKV